MKSKRGKPAGIRALPGVLMTVSNPNPMGYLTAYGSDGQGYTQVGKYWYQTNSLPNKYKFAITTPPPVTNPFAEGGKYGGPQGAQFDGFTIDRKSVV